MQRCIKYEPTFKGCGRRKHKSVQYIATGTVMVYKEVRNEICRDS